MATSEWWLAGLQRDSKPWLVTICIYLPLLAGGIPMWDLCWVETVTALWTDTSGSSVMISWFLNQLVSNMINKIIRALRESGYLKVRVCANVFKKLHEACVYSSFLVNEDTSLVSHILVRFKIIIIIKKGQSNRILSTFQSLFKFYFSYSIKFPTVPQHKMQHAEKGKKKGSQT